MPQQTTNHNTRSCPLLESEAVTVAHTVVFDILKIAHVIGIITRATDVVAGIVASQLSGATVTNALAAQHHDVMVSMYCFSFFIVL